MVKLSPDGAEAARYPAEVIASRNPEPWIVLHAIWTHRTVELDGLAFCSGDDLLEWFSPEHLFNAFAVHAPGGLLKGWYANVAYPAWLEETAGPWRLFWHDLYIDLVGLPNGTFTVRDEDELAESGMRDRDPRRHEQILEARDEIIRRFVGGLPPFTDVAHIPHRSG